MYPRTVNTTNKPLLFLLPLCVLLSTTTLHLFFEPVLIKGLPPMLVVVDVRASKCGVGNRMFHYAAGMGIAQRYPNATVCAYGMDEDDGHAHPQSVFRDVVEVLHHPLAPCPASVASRKLGFLDMELNLESMDLFSPPHSTYEPFFFDDSGVRNHFSGRKPVMIAASVQSFKYFISVPQPFYRPRHLTIAKKWLTRHGLTSVVHIRRGDKVKDGSVIVPVEYYESVLLRIGTFHVAVCTDDPEWAQQQQVFRNATLSPGNPAFDMALMASATNAVVIGIGTFGWWGAYLSQARQKFMYKTQYHGTDSPGYREEDYVPSDVQGEWIKMG